MKTAYELAMERLNKAAPMRKLTDAQKKKLGELDSKYAAKMAEREIVLQQQIEEAAGVGDFEKMEKLKQELANERKAIQADLEEKKEKVRQGTK